MNGRACSVVTRGGRGVTLVELLVSTVLAGLMLAMAWPWCWQVGGRWRADATAADASSTVATVRRVTLAEVSSAVALIRTPDTGCGGSSLAFVVPAEAGATTIVTYVWDERRGVLWRKAPGSHLAEAVTGFSVKYYDDEGRSLRLDATGYLADAELTRVRLVRFTLAIGEQPSTSWVAAVGVPA